VNDIKDHFNRILYPQSFATELEDIDNNDIIHLVITATCFVVEKHSEEDVLANELPEIRRALCCLVSFVGLFNIATGYQKIVSTPGNRRPPVPSPRITLRARLLKIKPFMMDDCHPTRNSSVAPPVQIYHPIFD